MKEVTKLLVMTVMLCATCLASAQLNGTYWAPSGKCFKFYDNNRYEYLSIITDHKGVVIWADTLTRGNYQILGKGDVIKLDTNPWISDIWKNNSEIVCQKSPKVGNDSVAIVFAFPLLEAMTLELHIDEYDSERDKWDFRDTTFIYDSYRSNTVLMPQTKKQMLISYKLIPFNLPSILMDDENVSSEYYLHHKEILIKKPQNRVIIRNEKNSQVIFDNIWHNGDYCLLSGDTINYKNMAFKKKEREFIINRAYLLHRCYQ